MFIKATIFLAGLAACVAQVPHFGKCPNVPIQANFNITQYTGVWYEIQKFFFFPLIGETCLNANYSLKADGHAKVVNSALKKDGSPDVQEGDAYAPDPNAVAKLAVKFGNATRVPYWIIDTDYKDYSLVWSCEEQAGGLLRTDLAWVLSRAPTLNQNITDMLVNKLISYGIDTSSFSKTVQTNCNYYY